MAPASSAAAAAAAAKAAPAAPKSMLSTLTKRVRTGFFMAGVATVWIFSGNMVFSVGFALQALLAQLEYYRMAMQKGALGVGEGTKADRDTREKGGDGDAGVSEAAAGSGRRVRRRLSVAAATNPVHFYSFGRLAFSLDSQLPRSLSPPSPSRGLLDLSLLLFVPPSTQA